MSATKQLRPQDNKDRAQEAQDVEEDFTKLVSDVTEAVDHYCRSRPGVVAGVLFGLGFFCGWKLRPW